MSDERRESSDRRTGGRTLEALIIQLDDNMRRDMKEQHDRLRVSINDISGRFERFEQRQEPRVRLIEDDLLQMKTERTMEDKNHAKQATFISVFVSAAIAGFVQAIRTYVTGKP